MIPPDCYHCPCDSCLVNYSLGIIRGGTALYWQHIGCFSFYHTGRLTNIFFYATQMSNQARWAVLQAFNLLKQHWKVLDVLVKALGENLALLWRPLRPQWQLKNKTAHLCWWSLEVHCTLTCLVLILRFGIFKVLVSKLTPILCSKVPFIMVCIYMQLDIRLDAVR